MSERDFIGFFEVMADDNADENVRVRKRTTPSGLRGTSLASTVRVVPASVGELLERADQPEHLGPVIRAYSLWYVYIGLNPVYQSDVHISQPKPHLQYLKYRDFIK